MGGCYHGSCPPPMQNSMHSYDQYVSCCQTMLCHNTLKILCKQKVRGPDTYGKQNESVMDHWVVCGWNYESNWDLRIYPTQRATVERCSSIFSTLGMPTNAVNIAALDRNQWYPSIHDQITKSEEQACFRRCHTYRHLGLSEGHFLPRFRKVYTPHNVMASRVSLPATTLTEPNRNLSPTEQENRLKRGTLKK